MKYGWKERKENRKPHKLNQSLWWLIRICYAHCEERVRRRECARAIRWIDNELIINNKRETHWISVCIKSTHKTQHSTFFLQRWLRKRETELGWQIQEQKEHTHTHSRVLKTKRHTLHNLIYIFIKWAGMVSRSLMCAHSNFKSFGFCLKGSQKWAVRTISCSLPLLFTTRLCVCEYEVVSNATTSMLIACIFHCSMLLCGLYICH